AKREWTAHFQEENLSSEPQAPGMLRTLMRMSKKKAEERHRTSAAGDASSENEDVASTVATNPSQTPSDLSTDLQLVGDDSGLPDGSIAEEVTVVITHAATLDDLRRIFGGSRIAAGCVCVTPLSVLDNAVSPVNHSEIYTAPPANRGQMGPTRRFPCLHATEVSVAEEVPFAKRLQMLLDHVTTDFIVVSSRTGTIHYAAINELVSRLKNDNSFLASGNIRHQAETGSQQSPYLASTHKIDSVVDFRDGACLGDFDLDNKVYSTDFIKRVVDFCVDNNLNEAIQIALTGLTWAQEYPISKEFVLSSSFPTESAAIRRYRNNVDVLADAIDAVESGIRVFEAIGNQELLHAWRVYAIGTLMSPY